jgi:hypothetical protein
MSTCRALPRLAEFGQELHLLIQCIDFLVNKNLTALEPNDEELFAL